MTRPPRQWLRRCQSCGARQWWPFGHWLAHLALIVFSPAIDALELERQQRVSVRADLEAVRLVRASRQTDEQSPAD